jgi:hypothetical protein
MYTNAWNYLQTSGQELLENYPYRGDDTGECTYNAAEAIVMTTDGSPYVSVGTDSVSIMTALDIMPQAIAIQSTSAVFQTYSSGVITSYHCGTALDHAVELVGYNLNDRLPYYVVKNSWGEYWGDGGYVKIGISNDDKGICGLNQVVRYPNIVPFTSP